jgi:hypothetical protein
MSFAEESERPLKKQRRGGRLAYFERMIDPVNASGFFASVWGKVPRVYKSANLVHPPFYNFGDNLMNVLETMFRCRGVNENIDSGVLVMKNGCPSTEYSSPAAAFLDGCSLVMNHVEASSKEVHGMCRELRDTFPHVYVNSYLTPPKSQAVGAHADDRDVLVWQCSGSKTWRVYADPPVPFPFPHEQVGKSDKFPVPEAVLNGTSKPCITVTLKPGDVLYMPRGYVHQAHTPNTEPSLHLTIALATHDWAWSKVVECAMKLKSEETGETRAFSDSCIAKFCDDVERNDGSKKINWRHSLPPALLQNEVISKALRVQVQQVIDSDDRLIGLAVEDVVSAFANKVAVHNKWQDDVQFSDKLTGCHMLSVGSFVRRWTVQEKRQREKYREENGIAENPAQRRGLVAREEIGDVLLAVLTAIDDQTPTQIKSFGGNNKEDSMFCDWSKVSFARVCIKLGLLCACTSSGKALLVHNDRF